MFLLDIEIRIAFSLFKYPFLGSVWVEPFRANYHTIIITGT